ncbi:MAG: hypothetical protein Q8S36_02215 [Sulfuricurvum sp.]|nr:hypothetical protein [Sulfuricurvum sp.]
MKILPIVFMTIILTTSMLFADDSINAQIEMIQKAPSQERVELMNRLKVKLASMNEEERSAAISSLRTGMKSDRMTTKVPQREMVGFQKMNQIQSTQHTTPMQNSGNSLNTQMPRMRH